MAFSAVRKILVPVDFSEGARKALTEADGIVAPKGGTLTLMHVHAIGQISFMDFTYVEPPEKVATECQTADDHLHEWMEGLATPADRIETQVITGSPIEQIVAASSDHDLIVMGTHRRTTLERLLSTSVAQRVIHMAHCPVLIVKTDVVPEDDD